MEENALIINIATILAKDIAFDQGHLSKKFNHFSPGRNKAPAFPLLESDDEAFTFFLRQRKQMEESNKRKKNLMTLAETSCKRVCSKQNDVFQINLVEQLDTKAFEANLHLSKCSFTNILDTTRKYMGQMNFNGRLISAETIFSLGLWKLATDEHFEEISRRFQVPLDQCHAIIKHFWNVVSENYENFIKWPNSQESQVECLSNFQSVKSLQVFRNLFGLIAIKRLEIFLESEDEETSVILQILCSADHMIIDCYVELVSKYSFETSPIGQKLESNLETIPPNCYLIGDCSFPLKRYLIRPFEIECFRTETQFNCLLNSAMQISDQVLNEMTRRFNTLYALEAKDMTEVRKVIETICSLHNLCQKFDDKVVDDYCKKSYSNSQYPIFSAVHNIKGSESDHYGRKMRFELMDQIGT